jgi:8-oxo-dGTP pyrophosphatase MutT (NUDIX family)
MGDGDGWVQCGLGHRHWGRFGACGLLLTDPAGRRIVLQHRSLRSHEGGTWGIPGGARDSGEDSVTAALREACEEAGIEPAAVAPLGWHRVDHGGWTYTTVLARPRRDIAPRAANWESDQMRWWPVDRVDELALHPGFAASWPELHRPAEPLTVVVDAAGVSGSGSAGPRGAEFLARVGAESLTLARFGVAPGDIPRPATSVALNGWLPRIVLVVAPVGYVGYRPHELVPAGAGADAWPDRQVQVVTATGSVEAEVAAQAGQAGGTVIAVGDGHPPLGPGVVRRDARWWRRQVDDAGPEAGLD